MCSRVMALLRFLPDISPKETRWKTGERRQELLGCINVSSVLRGWERGQGERIPQEAKCISCFWPPNNLRFGSWFRSKLEREINSECCYADIAAIFQNLNKVLTSVFSSCKELGRN